MIRNTDLDDFCQTNVGQISGRETVKWTYEVLNTCRALHLE